MDVLQNPFNHRQSDDWEIFWGMKLQGNWKSASEKCKISFLHFSNFWDFFAHNWIFALYSRPPKAWYWPPHDKMSSNIPLLKLDSEFSCAWTCYVWQNWLQVLKCEQKLTKYWKLAKMITCNYLRHTFTYLGMSYLQKIPKPCLLGG